MSIQKIGYQGDTFSNNTEASKLMAKKLSLSEVEFLPLISSYRVVNALLDGTIKYGVVAVENSLAGIVEESKIALSDIEYEILCTEKLHIHHCLFKYDDTIADSDINTVVSHIQALNQCKKNISQILPNAKCEEVDDTAIGARYLKEGKLPKTTAVICRKDAGENNGLRLIEENIEDSDLNFTTFIFFKLKD